MDDKLYYEKKNVTTAAEVKQACDYAVENNFKYYRAVTEKGVYFGWVDGKHQRAAAGQDWFENPNYKEEEVLLSDNSVESLTKCAKEAVSGIIEVVEAPAIEAIRPVELDYGALYEERCKELDNYKHRYEEANAELVALKSAIFTLVKEVKEANDILKE